MFSTVFSRQGRFSTLLITVLLAACVAPQAAQSAEKRKPAALTPVHEAAPSWQGDVAAGRIASSNERCQECHGADGHAQHTADGAASQGKFPRLAGQRYDYLVKQLYAFRKKQRKSDEMQLAVKNLDEQDLHDIAAYYASLPAASGAGGSDKAAIATRLVNEGDAARSLPACASCHQRAVSIANTPLLHGQHERYLQKQLSDFRSRERRDAPDDVMSRIAMQLSDEEINALSAYFSAQ